jgi:DNA end-binding protein Ku
MVRITEHILETKQEDFDTAYLEDRYRTVLAEKLREKQTQMPRPSVASVPSQQNVINLMDALRRSIEAEQPAKTTVKKPPAASRTARATPRGRRTLKS